MRLIDKDVLLKKLGNNSWDIDEWDLPSEQITGGLMANAMDRKTVEEMPTVDAVPVVRCKDCAKWDRKDGTFKDVDDKEWHNCKTLCFLTMAYFYCADAEREEE